ncbi:MAG TPA: sulfatase [Bacteroidales bacterium]|nr:sulfatase [Bacteroidales bacterium]
MFTKNNKLNRLLAISFLSSSIPMMAQQQQKPNILFIFADDWGKHASIYGELEGDKSPSAIVKTPNFDKIAKNGVLFTNAHVNSPSSTPCRSALLSGQYFFRTGMGSILLGAEWDFNIPTYPLLLQEQGYDIGYMYKVWSPGTPIDAGYGGIKNAFHNHGRNFNGFSQYVSSKLDSIEEAKEELYAQVRGNFQDFLKTRKSGQPFCFWFGPTNTHRSWTKGSGKKIWGINPDDLKGKMPACYADVPEIREDFADYLGEVQAVDAGIGVVIDELKKIGEYENTLIVISGDHGAGGFPRSKTNLYDIGTHVALAISWKGKIPDNRVVTDFVNLMDLAPTFLDAGGVKVPEVMTGKSLMPILLSNKQGRVEKERNYVLTGRERHVYANEGNLPYPQRAITTDDYLYIRNFKPDRWPEGSFEMGMLDIDGGPAKDWIYRHFDDPIYKLYIDYAYAKRPYEELYDLKKDPHQVHNVAGLTQYKDAKSRLSQLMDKILIETKDPRMSENPLFENPPYTSGKGAINWENHVKHLMEVYQSGKKQDD